VTGPQANTPAAWHASWPANYNRDRPDAYRTLVALRGPTRLPSEKDVISLAFTMGVAWSIAAIVEVVAQTDFSPPTDYSAPLERGAAYQGLRVLIKLLAVAGPIALAVGIGVVVLNVRRRDLTHTGFTRISSSAPATTVSRGKRLLIVDLPGGATAARLATDLHQRGWEVVTGADGDVADVAAIVPVIDGSVDIGRLDDDAHPVARVLEAALHDGTPVVPVLVDGQPMPKSGLPPSLAGLAGRNAIGVFTGRNWQDGVDAVAAELPKVRTFW
jgi:hypothetical protein